MTDRATPTSRARLVVLYGGKSAEHEVSCVSAAHVLAAADRDRYELVPVAIDQDGRWLLNEEAAALAAAGAAALPGHIEISGVAVEPPVALATPDPARPTVVLPLVHGPHGEDGTLQGLLELADVPYVGSGVLGSAICMDKTMAKTLAGSHGLPQAKALNLTPGSGGPGELANRVETLMALGEIAYPVFVKPANMGSSVGITKAHDHAELIAALELALTYDERLVVEESIDGREIEVAVLGNAIGDRPPRASIPGEIVAGAEFYDYSDKYSSGSATLLIPAELDEDESAIVRELALEAYAALRCDGMARVDFFYEREGRGFLLNEINTIPGFTPLSMYPKLWKASGVGYAELIDELVDLAIERHQRRSAFRTDA
ncbi:MAG TPA: D-alanine--D-alanine ligase family protein [Acidimicrobiales bacterium]|nr:D-alanine--D-alanine ligase family protein [Acidimicrobiales bacterium]